MEFSDEIIVGVDGSRTCQEAAAWALKEARNRGCDLRLVSVAAPAAPGRAFAAQPFPASSAAEPVPASSTAGSPTADSRAAAESALAEVSDRLRDLLPDVPFDAVVETGDPAEVLAGMSERAGLVVIGHHGSDQQTGGRIGTISSGLPGHALCPVLVHRDAEASEFDSPDAHVQRGGGVVVGLDTSDYAGVAALDAADYAARTGTDLRIIVVTTPLGDDERARAQTELDMAWLRSRFPGLQVSTEFVEGDPAEVLTARSAGADLLVLGKRGLGRFTGMRVQLGRTSSRVLSAASCSVLLVPFRDDPALDQRRTAD